MSRYLSAFQTRTLSSFECRAMRSSVGLFQFTEDFIFESDLVGRRLVVPAGFITDFASIPWYALWYIDRDDPGIAYGSGVHDFGYSKDCDWNLDRPTVDSVLRECMTLDGAREDQIAVVHALIRLRGGSHWKT